MTRRKQDVIFCGFHPDRLISVLVPNMFMNGLATHLSFSHYQKILQQNVPLFCPNMVLLLLIHRMQTSVGSLVSTYKFWKI